MKYKLSVINYKTGDFDVIFDNLNRDQAMFYIELIDKNIFKVKGIKFDYDEVKIEKVVK